MYTDFYGGDSSSGENDTVLYLYSDPVLTNQIAYNNDNNLNTEFSEIVWSMTEGTTYYIKLQHYINGLYDMDEVYMRLAVTAVPPATSTNIIDDLPFDTPVNVELSTGEYKIHQFTPAITGYYQVSTSYIGDSGKNVLNDTRLALYSDSEMKNLLQSNDNYSASPFSLINYMTAGSAYYIKIDHTSPRGAVYARLSVIKSVTNSNSYTYS